MKNYERLRGLIAATFTPMHPNGDIHYSVIGQYAQHIVDSGISGVFVCGTTGEFTSLTTEERKLILEHWVKAADGRLKVIAHVGSDNQRESIELSHHAGKVGAWGVGAIAPVFFKPAWVHDLVSFFKPIAAAASELPFYYYNMPSMTGVSLSVAQFLLEGKREIPNLAGVKYTHNNLMEMGDCIHLNHGEFEVLHGFDETLIGGVAVGAVAGVGSTYNYIPAIYLQILKVMSEGDVVRARAYQMQSIEIVKIIIKYGGGIRGGKAIMNLIGIECGDCRPPIAPFTHEEYVSLESDLRKLNIIETKERERFVRTEVPSPCNNVKIESP